MSVRVFISGCSPDTSGAGRWVRRLLPEYEKNGYRIIVRRVKRQLRPLIGKCNLWRFISEIILRVVDCAVFALRCSVVKGAHVVCIHPQKIGLKRFSSLAKNNRPFEIYLADNAFFCIRSYNHHPISHKECLNCIGVIKPDEACEPFPVKYKKSDNVAFLIHLKEIAQDLTFLCQSENQILLLNRHFGSGMKSRVVGMDTGETIVRRSGVQTLARGFDVVYHAAPLPEKGLLFTLELARRLQHYRFLIPSSRYIVQEQIAEESIPVNVTCQDLTWETGLKDQVELASLVLIPSLWSAPIEGALIKSAHHNACIATIKSSFGYESIFKGDARHLRLSPEINKAVLEMDEFLRVELANARVGVLHASKEDQAKNKQTDI